MLNDDDGENRVDLSKLIERVKAILTAPKTTWPVIAEEPATIGDIYKNYVVVLAALAALLTLVAYSMVGIHVPFLGAVLPPLTARWARPRRRTASRARWASQAPAASAAAAASGLTRNSMTAP